MTEHTEQPAPIPRQGVPSIQAAVRADLRVRELVGIERYGTPLQPHNGRDALRDAYEEALDLVCYLRQVITERDGWSAPGFAMPDGQCLDYDLAADVIAEACPEVLSDLAARAVADRALAILAHTEGVTVVRGADSIPWTPELAVEEHICCEHAS